MTTNPDSLGTRWLPATVWLSFCLLVDAVTIGFFFFILIRPMSAPHSTLAIHVVGLALTIGQATSVIALLRWHRSGYWGILVLTIAAFALNLAAYVPLSKAAVGLANPLLTWLVLQGGKPRSTWSRLR